MAEDGAVDAGVKLAEQLQAPVCTSYLHNDSFPKSHPLNMGPLGYQVPIIKLSLSFFGILMYVICMYSWFARTDKNNATFRDWTVP